MNDAHQIAARRAPTLGRGGLIAFDVGVAKTPIAAIVHVRQERWARTPAVLVPSRAGMWKRASQNARRRILVEQFFRLVAHKASRRGGFGHGPGGRKGWIP